MANIGAGFTFSVLTFYSMYLYFRRNDEYNGELAYFHVTYQIYYYFYSNKTVRTGHLIGGDVC